MSSNHCINSYSTHITEWTKLGNKENTYILAESAINQFVWELACETYSSNETNLYWDYCKDQHASISPYLLKLTDWDLFAQRIAFQPNWGIFIRIKPYVTILSNVQATLLAQLRQWTLVETPDKEQMLLRISDFQVLKVLCSASNEAELNGLFDPILEFAYWQKGQESVEVLSMAETPETAERVPYRSPQCLSEAQYTALSTFATLNQHKEYAKHLKAHHPKLNSWQDSQLADFLSRNISKAQDYAFNNKQDTVRYLSLAVVFGEDFDQKNWAKAQLSKTQVQGTQSRMDKLYQTALSEVDNE